MATWESGPTPSATAGSLNPPTFATVRRGYDPAQVLEYVTRLTDRLDDLATEVRRLQGELSRRDVAPKEQAPTGQDQYEGVGARVADLMRAFDQDVERLHQDAEAEAGRIVAEASAEADRIRLDAQSKAEDVRLQATEALREAQKESDKVLSSLASRRQALLGELRAIRDRMLGTTRDLEATIEGASTDDQVVVVEDAEAGRPT